MRKIGGNIGDVVSQVSEFLDARLAAGDLVTFNGKVCRDWLREEMDLGSHANISRNPQLGALFTQFDSRLDGYLSHRTRAKLQEFNTLVAFEPQLNQDGVRVNRTALARAMGIPVRWFHHDSPYKMAADAEDDRRLGMAKMHPLIVSEHGRFYDFRELELSYRQRAPAVVEAIRRELGNCRSTSGKRIYLTFVWFLRWLASSPDQACKDSLDEIVGERLPNTRDWDDTVHRYREHLISTTSAASVAGQITLLRSVARCLAKAGLVPPVSTDVRMPKNAKRQVGHRKSIVEVLRIETERGDPAYLRFVRQSLLKAQIEFDSGTTSDEKNVFLESLDSDLADQIASREASVPAAFLRQLNRRLDALSRHAWAVVQEGQARILRGRELLQMADIEPVGFEKALLAAKSRRLKSVLTRTYFPLHDAARSIANLLRLGVAAGMGRLPTSGIPHGHWGHFFTKRYQEFGEPGKLEGYLYPTAETAAAVFTLYLCETGANLAVGFSLKKECIEPSDLAAHVRITGVKIRSVGKPIIVDLANSSRAVQAMRWMSDNVGPLRSLASADHSDGFFLCRIGGRVQCLTEPWYCAWFKRFTPHIPEVCGLPITPSMIRHSILLRAALENDGRLQAGRAIGQHTERVTEGYQKKWVVRLLYDENIRRFQEGIEALMLENRASVAGRMNISIDELERRASLARGTGLGTFCLDSTGRPNSNGDPCTQLDCASGSGCPQLVLVADVKAIAELQLWQKSLRAVQGDWERDHPQRWEVVWLPWLCLADVVEEKMSRGKLLQVWRRSSELAAHTEVAPGYFAPRPW